MSVLILLIFASLGLATAFLTAFIWAVRSGQYEDTCTPSLRLLADEPCSTRSKSSFQPKPDQEENS